MPDPLPMIDDLALTAVQRVRQEVAGDLAPAKVMGLDGRVHQRFGRGAHRVTIDGLLVGETAADDLATLQEKASAGDEVSFVADITAALDIESMVITSFAADQLIGPGVQYAYRVVLEESPPLPPPAAVAPFGGLDGLGDLGFGADALGDVLGDIADQAGAVMEALDGALDALEGLEALAGIADIGSVGNVLAPVTDEVSSLAGLAGPIGSLTSAAGGLTGGGDG